MRTRFQSEYECLHLPLEHGDLVVREHQSVAFLQDPAKTLKKLALPCSSVQIVFCQLHRRRSSVKKPRPLPAEGLGIKDPERIP